MISYGANLGLMVNAATGEVHDVALRGFLRGIDGLVQPNVKGYLTNTPPGSPSDGDVYIIGAAPTGAWAGNAGKVTRWYANDGAWDFYTPKNGWMLQANSARESYRYTGGSWEIFYQEGTWTPVDLSGDSLTLTSSDCTYTKIGRIFYAGFNITFPETTGSNQVKIGGLPAVASGDVYPVAFSLNSNSTSISGLVRSFLSRFDVFTSTSSAPVANSSMSLGNIRGSVTFIS